MNPSYLEKYGLGLISNNYKIIPIKKGSKIECIDWKKVVELLSYSQLVVAHNASFDINILKNEMRHLGFPDIDLSLIHKGIF